MPPPPPPPPAATAVAAAGPRAGALSGGCAESLAILRRTLLAHIAGLEDGVEAACARAAAGGSDASYALAHEQLQAVLALTRGDAWRGCGAA